jgi:tRNA(Ile)-lysidine synthase
MPAKRGLSPAEIFGDLHPKGIVIVAVSGGGDSIALLLLANAWSQTADISLHAVTVDHGLRPEAAAEAAFVASLCDGLGVDHTTLAWDGIKPHAGIANAARRARYALIEEFAMEIGADMILAGHTINDQAETVHMRLGRTGKYGDGFVSATGRGLSGMARRCLMPAGCELVRPLLGIERARLREYLAGFPQNWIEDPTNYDESYERVRVRRQLEADGERMSRLVRFSRAMGSMRSVLSRDTAELLGATVEAEPGGVLVFDHRVAAEAPRLVLVQAVQMILAVAGGGEHLVPRRKIEELLKALTETDFTRVTLGNAVIEKADAKLRFYRERRDIPTIWVGPGESSLWDGRIEIVNNGAKSIRVGPLTRTGLREIEDRRAGRFPAHPRAALLTCGVVSVDRGENWLPLAERKPAIPQVQVRQTARAIAHFCPEWDSPLLEWLKRLDKARSESLQSRA